MALKTWMKVGVVILVLPLCIVGALAAIGAQIAESQGQGGHVDPPEVVRARIFAARAAWQAMTPAQHLAAARSALARRYDPVHQVGGDLRDADAHLRAIAVDSPEHAAIAGIVSEMNGRKHRAVQMVAPALAHALVAPPEVGPGSCHRRAIATQLNAVCIDGDFDAAGENGTVLRLTSPECGEALLDATVPIAQRARVRVMGFRSIECVSPAATVSVAL